MEVIINLFLLFQVKLIDTLETVESSLFVVSQRNWSLTQIGGNTVYIKVDGEGNPVSLMYEDREKYCEEVRKLRLTEFDEQVSECYKVGQLVF